jgi:hypothetical protein
MNAQLTRALAAAHWLDLQRAAGCCMEPVDRAHRQLPPRRINLRRRQVEGSAARGACSPDGQHGQRRAATSEHDSRQER